MTLPLTPHVLVAAYEYLRATAPFRRWALPPADEVEFCVTRHRDREGDHDVRGAQRDHVLRVSSYWIKTTSELMEVMAHEMIHAKQRMTRTASNDKHNAEFHRLAQRVCQQHGWDKIEFMGPGVDAA